MDKPMKGFKELVNKLKGIKNIEINLAVSIGLIILVIYFLYVFKLIKISLVLFNCIFIDTHSY